MAHPTVSETLFEKTTLHKACAYCGAKLEVLVARAAEGNEPFDYDCLECGKQYETEAAMQPEVRLVAPRNDGKTDRYQETMF
ncbi:hypothetical protein [Ramlibacter albus]|uniref:Uncharacterized protein n=1 Tax=Ramlibacter albus TaxID=2079448 RepID=A0A923S3V4_9BURK|nr:hypothetical protein [Ramlibacter albus]MBC5766238.1 hypothetical protein [Ramlibacter albus]